jgi:hypothetical protein
LLRRFTRLNDIHVTCHCERGEAIFSSIPASKLHRICAKK